MEYLLVEIVVYLVGAGLIGFVMGWILRAELIVESAAKNEEEPEVVASTKEEPKKVFQEKSMEKVVLEETVAEVKNKEVANVVTSEAAEEASEVIKEEVLEETYSKEEMSQPTLFSKAPAKGSDELSALKGLGPALEKKLNNLGVYTYEQMASWTEEQQVWVGTQVAFPNKVLKEEWVKQAQDLLTNK